MTAQYRRIIPPELDLGRAEDVVGNRWRLVTDLNFAVDDEEASAETLLKAFDLSLYDCDLKHQPRLDDAQAAATAPAELVENRSTELPPSSQNPFLSTPLRLKHFSKLSPSILRALLRSPSLRCPSFGDDSLDSAPNSLSPIGSPAAHWCPDNSPLVNADSDFQSREPSLPLTPPPTARIPFSTQLFNPHFAKPSLPRPETTNATLTTPFVAAQPNSLVSPSAVRNFQRVIDEMKGVDSNPNSVQEPAGIDEEISFLQLSSPRLSSPLNKGLLTPEADAHDVVLPSPPRSKDFMLGTLEDEFVALLQQRAMEEEEDAAELRALADRLGRIAGMRRHLAAMIVERKNEQQKLDSKK
ncbi:hypothetical protein MSAN_01428000 [Mycena sanguinolenta]|uniref:Uncharacterized protein n=1 Tax=Mycena sanguinolenta TaxID=230812 RepID=A0A8H6Y9X1_9AGAR|nr:hypothetical protein MSAN_01428000 [Mycena sanguinolenta]